ncbi:MAG: DUF192 domain-containing protein [Patescibacteria group bacterium]
METKTIVKEKSAVHWGVKVAILLVFVPVILGVYSIVNNNLPQKVLTLGGHQLRVEIAASDRARTKGLSGRESLTENQGMLFIFPTYARQAFWMKQMNFPLDLIWLRDGQVIGFKQDLPPEGNQPAHMYQPDENVNWVLEMPAGFVAKNQIKIGDMATIK